MWIELLAGIAWAGACCTSTTTTTPARVGECEHVAASLQVEGEKSVARWDGAAMPREASTSETGLATTLAVGWRWSRAAQLQVALPVRWSWRTAADLDDNGGGVGDLRVGMLFDPVEEHEGPVPVLSLGARIPTGRTWKESDSPLLADVTGLPGPALLAGVSLERTLTTVPWSVGLDVEAGPGAPVVLGLGGSVGRALGSDWTVTTGLRVRGTFTGQGSHATLLSAQVIRGEHAWRAWGGVTVGVPIPGLGRYDTASVVGSIGAAWVH